MPQCYLGWSLSTTLARHRSCQVSDFGSSERTFQLRCNIPFFDYFGPDVVLRGSWQISKYKIMSLRQHCGIFSFLHIGRIWLYIRSYLHFYCRAADKAIQSRIMNYNELCCRKCILVCFKFKFTDWPLHVFTMLSVCV